MPNNVPPCTTQERLHQKIKLVDAELKEARLPLRRYFFFGADKDHLHEIVKVKKEIIGVKLYLGCSTNHLCLHDPGALRELFSLCAQLDLRLAIHAEDQALLDLQKKQYTAVHDVRYHGLLRPKEAAIKAVAQSIELAQEYKTTLYFCHVSTKEELALIEQAKKDELLVFAEATPHHLLLSDGELQTLGTRGQVNPPLRTPSDVEALWEGIHSGVIDTIGSDHAPHTLEEKRAIYPDSPSGMPGVETTLPLLLECFHQKKITLEKIVELTRLNIENIFRLPPNNDLVFVDLHEERELLDKNLKTKCGWSAFSGRKLHGWPKMVTVDGEVFDV
jgi:dihydroorotase